jgi:hypothetical protein
MQRRLGRRGVGDASGRRVSNVLIVAAVVLLTGGLTLPILILVAASRSLYISRRGLEGLLLRPHPMAVDLIQAGLDPEVAAVGLWAHAVSRRRARSDAIVWATLALLVAGLAALAVYVAMPESIIVSGWIFTFWGFIGLAALLAASRGRPHGALAAQARQTRSLVRSIHARSGARSFTRDALRAAGLSALAIVAIYVVFIIVLLAPFWGAVGMTLLMKPVGVDPQGLLTFITWSAFNAAAGAGIGAVWARHAIKHGERRLDAMTADLRYIFEWIETREDAEIQRKARQR